MIRAAMFRVAATVISLVTCSLGGCAASLPTYPAMPDADALGLIATRLDSVKSISGSADLSLTDAKGQTVSLEGVIVAQPPARARLRAWKFGSPVLDVTILPEGVWAYAASRAGSTAADMTRLPAAGVSRSVEMLAGSYFAGAHTVAKDSTIATLVVVGAAFGREDVRCEIDRATLTPRRFVMNTPERSLEIILDGYSLVSGTAWAKRMEFRSPDGTIVIRLGDIELNGDIAQSAFVPSTRATKLP